MTTRAVLALALWSTFALATGLGRRETAPAATADTFAHLRQVDAALGEGDVPGALRAWHLAYQGALGSRQWSPMIATGDAWLRIGAAGGGDDPRPRARRQYLRALFRAREQGSLDGVLQAAAAFASLGDREVVEQCLRIAERVGGRAVRRSEPSTGGGNGP